MDIKLIPIGSGASFTFPALPEKIKGSYAANYQSFDIISRGSVRVPKGTAVTEFSWDGEFFGASKKNEQIVRKNHWTSPNECVRILTKYMEKETPLNLIVTKTWINVDVTVSSFQPTAYGAFGNIKYSIKLSIKKDLKIFTTDELKIAAFVKKVVPRNDSPAAPAASSSNTYTVVSGDSLWAIAKKFYGNGAEWKKIYDANTSVCGQPYTKGGTTYVMIHPGDVLTIP